MQGDEHFKLAYTMFCMAPLHDGILRPQNKSDKFSKDFSDFSDAGQEPSWVKEIIPNDEVSEDDSGRCSFCFVSYVTVKICLIGISLRFWSYDEIRAVLS